jgi:hypothetical protein
MALLPDMNPGSVSFTESQQTLNMAFNHSNARCPTFGMGKGIEASGRSEKS